MVAKKFRIKRVDFENKPISIFQHKLRVLMKCYTIKNLILNETEYTVAFKKTHRLHGVVMNDPKEYIARYEVADSTNHKEIILKIII